MKAINLRYLLLILPLSAILLSNCATSSSITSEANSEITIAFGSCNHQWEAQPIWDQVRKNKPDAWIWLGDIIYSDTEDMKKMKADYDMQQQQSDYANLVSETDIYGIWDDHDYGINNGGKEFPKKDSSKMLLFDFLNLDITDSVHAHQGVYQSHLIKRGDLDVKIILLDVRYFRDTPSVSNASILGSKQWQWLVNEFQQNNADVHIIGSGTQVLPEEHKYEKWANFGSDRMRLLQILDLMKVNNPILLSGDRHIAEMSLVGLPQSGDPLLEITSSGLTHSYDSFTSEINKHRVQEVYPKKNFGILKIKKDGEYLDYTAEILSENNKKVLSIKSFELLDIIKKKAKK